jgi:hypothetical protein
VDRCRANAHNLVSLLQHEQGLTVQGALTAAGNTVKRALESASAAERTLCVLAASVPYRVPGALPLAPLDSPDPHADDVRLFVRGLRDVMIGAVHWLYETEFYFDNKGDEVRQFGWVFLSP